MASHWVCFLFAFIVLFPIPLARFLGARAANFNLNIYNGTAQALTRVRGVWFGGSGGTGHNCLRNCCCTTFFTMLGGEKSNEKSMSWPCKQHAILRYTYRYLGILRPADTLGYLVRYSWPPRPAQLLNKAKWPQAAALRHTHNVECCLQLLDNIIQ